MSILTAYDRFIQQALKYGFSLFGLPKTGQTTVYQSGDDGTYKKGYPKTGARFVDNGDGTITDMATGLMWAQDASGVGCYNGGTRTWTQAITWAEALNFAGHTDWRLPNIKELHSIIDYAAFRPSINPIFTGNNDKYFWSSTTYFVMAANAWKAYFRPGDIISGVKTDAIYVRAVRGGA